MKFTIGLKIVVLASLLVSVTVFLLGKQVANEGHRVLVDHEEVDLADETHLECRRILSYIETMREDALALAASGPVRDILAAGDATDLDETERARRLEKARGELSALFAKVIGDGQSDAGDPDSGFKPYLHVRYIDGGDGAEMVRVECDGDSIRIVDADELECLATAADIFSADGRVYRQTMEQAARQAAAGSVQRVFMSDLDLFRDPTQDAAGGQPVLRAMVPVWGPAQEKPSGMIMINLDLDRAAQRLRTSPRHVTFLTDERGRFLVHPDQSQELGQHPRGDDPTPTLFDAQLQEELPILEGTFERAAENEKSFAGVRKLPFEFFQPRQVEVPKANGGPRFDLGPLTFYFVKIDAVGQPPDSEELGAILLAEEKQDPSFRWGLTVPTATRITLSSRDRAKLSDVVATLQQRFPRRLAVADIVECTRGSLTAYRLPFDPSDPTRFLFLARAASIEEIVADADAIESHFHGLLTYFIPAAIFLAFLFSYLLTRPLKKIAAVTKDVSASGGTAAVDLPVNARDEIGDLARSFHEMIGQIRRRETTIKESEARLRAIVDTAAEGIITIDEQGCVESANRAAEQIFGYGPDEVTGQPFRTLLASASHGTYDEQLGQYLDTLNSILADSTGASAGSSVIGRLKILGTAQELQGQRKDGTVFPIELSLSQVRLGARRVFTGIVRDITERKRHEDQITQLARDLDRRVKERTAELQSANEMLAVARDAALEGSRAKDTFLANMSHELRNPLNAIIGFSEMLQEEALESGHPEYEADLQKVQSAGKHLLGLINDVLDIAKISAGTITIRCEPFEIRPMLRGLTDMVEPLVAKRGNRLVVDVDPSLGTMTADEGRVRQVLFNLLSNAAKFTENGTITFTARPLERSGQPWIEFSVVDTGVGMTEEQLSLLFQRFSQVSTSQRHKQDGAGLGLALSRELCRLMGGDISVKSAFGAGSTFTALLPFQAPTGDSSETLRRQPAATRLVPAAATNGDGTSAGDDLVLVIDDDVTVRELMQRQLIREGYRVVTAGNGEEGLRLAKELHPAAITLDTIMPEVDGWGVLAALKADPATTRIPVVMVTMLDDRQRGYALGAADYLTKPVDWDRLKGLLARFHDQRRHGPILVVEDDEDARKLMIRMLRGEGWEVAEAENGREALQFVQRQRPALILLDLMMPELDGFEVLQRLRYDEQTRQIPVVVVTARDLTVEDRRRLEGSVRQVLAKDGSLQEEVLAAIREQLAADRRAPLAPGGSPSG